MALNTVQQVRLKIQDIPLIADNTYYGDGLAASFMLPHRNLTTASAYVPVGGTAWSATGATFNPSGQVSFSGVISANSAFRVAYTHSTFSDDEIGQFTADGGGVLGAAKEAVVALMFDAVKRASWTSPDGASYSDTQAQEHLRAMYEKINTELEQAAAMGGGVVSWSQGQGG